MSEKRFVIVEIPYDDFIINDTVEDKEIYNNSIVDLLNEQQATINILLEELVNAQQQGYVIGFLHKNGRCNLTPKELEDE